jgi:hypothetical protein
MTAMNDRANALALRALLMVASLGLCGTVLFAVAWRHAASTTLSVEGLGDAERRRLTSELLELSPGIFQPSLVNPAIAYTLKPIQRIRAWGSVFTSNELG